METITKTLNGLNLEQLSGSIEAIKQDPEIALFRFRSHTDWVEGVAQPKLHKRLLWRKAGR